MSARTLRAGELTVDLAALRRNHRTLLAELGGVPLAAAVKADAYGLGVAQVAPVLWNDGCRRFFVAHLAEGVALRRLLPRAWVAVLDGPIPGTTFDLAEAGLVPVLNSLEQIALWSAESARRSRPLAAALHVDTGMGRLGLPVTEVAALGEHPELLDGLQVEHVMSHLASADLDTDEAGSQTDRQLAAFRSARQVLPFGSASLANSAGIFLGPDFHFDLARPGISLYGGSPRTAGANPMEGCVTLEVPLLQVRDVVPGETVGYGATHTVLRPGRVATIQVGYADGFFRSASSSGMVTVGDRNVPVIGRVSMDLVTVDVTEVPESQLALGAPVELLGPHQPLDRVAERAGTIAYEVLTRLGARFRTRHVDGSI